ncbi:MAG: zinc ribbon domain-containing protein [Clostridia bacterium]|nr:zinc ribbon domain-containing protein [Clostridia bacterium]
MAEKTASARRFGCPSCGGALRYALDTRDGKPFLCTQCGSTWFGREIAPDEPDTAEETVEVTAYRCPQCGAEIVSGGTEATSFCSYCGSDVVLEQRLSRMQRPSRIVPFAVSRQRCERIYRDHLRGKLLAPGSVRKQSVVGHFRPIYIPFWSYRVRADGTMTFRGTTVRRDRDATVTTVKDLETEIEADYSGILYDASRAFEDETAARLSHDLKHAVPFHPVYLSGMYAQAPDAEPELYRSEAVSAAYQAVVSKVMAVHHLQRIETSTEGVPQLPGEQVEQELLLLPVWLLAHRRGDRMLYAAVNGDTGDIVCEVPVSPPRVILSTILLAAALFALMYLLPVIRADWLLLPCAMLGMFAQVHMLRQLRMLSARETRETEPDFDRPDGYRGPAYRTMRADLARMSGRNPGGRPGFKELWRRATSFTVEVPRSLGKRLLLLPYVLFRTIGMLMLVMIAPLLILLLVATAIGGDMLSIRILILAVCIGGILYVLWTAFWIIRGIPQGRYRTFGTAHSGLSAAVNAAAVAIFIRNPAQDWICYIACVAILALTVTGMVYLWSRHNRYVTRPVPFFGEEADAP